MAKAQQRHATCIGNMTKILQESFLEREIKSGRLSPSTFDSSVCMSLDAPSLPDQPLFFWQIYSMTGREPIISLAKSFYESVFSDEDRRFVEAFGRSSVPYHSIALSLALLDSFGGGRHYGGGEHTLQCIHSERAGAVMNQYAAQKWSFHMHRALLSHRDEMNAIDCRIIPALEQYFHHIMSRYADKFGFSMDGVTFSPL